MTDNGAGANTLARVLGIDPGHTIGFALATSPEVAAWALLVRHEELSEAILTSLVIMGSPTSIVVEGLPNRNIDAITQQVYSNLIKWFTVAGFPVHVVGPGRYKETLTRTKWSSTHVRDASDLARWSLMNPDSIGTPVSLKAVMRII